MSQCEICDESFPILDQHHIESKCFGGEDKEYNKTKICPNCHRLVHFDNEDRIVIEGRFMSCIGNILVWRHKGEESITGFEDPKVYLITKEK